MGGVISRTKDWLTNLATRASAQRQEVQLSKPTRQVITYGQTLLVVAGLIALIYLASTRARVDLTADSVWILVLALVWNLTSLIAMSKRLQLILRTSRMDVTFPAANRINMQSFYYLFLLPLGIGMEAARIVKLRSVLPDKATTGIAVAVLSDRVLGLVTSVAFGAVAFVWVFAPTWWTWAALAAFAGLGALAAIVMKIADIPMFQSAKLIGISGVSYCAAVIAVYYGAIAVGIEINVVTVLFAMTVGLVGAVVPFALAGAGVGDAATAGALAAVGVDPISAALIASIAYLGRMVGAFWGAYFELKARF